MAERITIARPYAKAAFAEAHKLQHLAEWSEGLALAAAVSGDERVRPLFGNPHVKPSQLVELMAGIAGARIDENLRRFLVVLAENRRLNLLPEISKLYDKFRAEQERVLDVTLTSAVELSAQQHEQFAQALRRRFDRKIRLHTQIDTSLLGGAVVQADDLVIDGSVRGGLAQLAAQIAG
jgi:F-type H+-transporting ATPase subunit delta